MMYPAARQGYSWPVEALGGSISIESPPGAGTRITAELPLELEVREER